MLNYWKTTGRCRGSCGGQGRKDVDTGRLLQQTNALDRFGTRRPGEANRRHTKFAAFSFGHAMNRWPHQLAKGRRFFLRGERERQQRLARIQKPSLLANSSSSSCTNISDICPYVCTNRGRKGSRRSIISPCIYTNRSSNSSASGISPDVYKYRSSKGRSSTGVSACIYTNRSSSSSSSGIFPCIYTNANSKSSRSSAVFPCTYTYSRSSSTSSGVFPSDSFFPSSYKLCTVRGQDSTSRYASTVCWSSSSSYSSSCGMTWEFENCGQLITHRICNYCTAGVNASSHRAIDTSTTVTTISAVNSSGRRHSDCLTHQLTCGSGKRYINYSSRQPVASSGRRYSDSVSRQLLSKGSGITRHSDYISHRCFSSSCSPRNSDCTTRYLLGLHICKGFSRSSSSFSISYTQKKPSSAQVVNSSCSRRVPKASRESKSYDTSAESCNGNDSALYVFDTRSHSYNISSSNNSKVTRGRADGMVAAIPLRACILSNISRGSSPSEWRNVAADGLDVAGRRVGSGLLLQEMFFPLFASNGRTVLGAWCFGGLRRFCIPRMPWHIATALSGFSPPYIILNGVAADRGVSSFSSPPCSRSHVSGVTWYDHVQKGRSQYCEQQQQQPSQQRIPSEPEQQRDCHRVAEVEQDSHRCQRLQCIKTGVHEREFVLPSTSLPPMMSQSAVYPVQQMQVNVGSSYSLSSVWTTPFLWAAAAADVPLLQQSHRCLFSPGRCFSSTNYNNKRNSAAAAAEPNKTPVSAEGANAFAKPAQQPDIPGATTATGNAQQQQTQRAPTPLQQPIQRQARSAGASPNTFTTPKRGAASSTSSKLWSFFSLQGLLRLSFRLASSLWGSFVRGMRTCWKYLRMILSNPMVVKKFWKKGKESAIHTWRWTVTGFSLFYANLRVSYQLLKKKILGHPLRYNEHKLLVRTTADALKLIPFSLMIVIPLGELLLPVMLRLFPNMLPSTFFEKQVDNAYLSRKLKAKQELAAFFQELVREHTKHIIEHESNDALKDKAKALREFQEKLLRKDQKDVNPFLSLKDIISFAKLFKEEFVLEKLDLQTLQVMCKLLGIEPYSLPSHVILQLRYHLNNIQREDREFMWEGVETLSHDELVEACKDRAMMFHSISDDDMREQMRQWLEISSHKDIPPLLLLWCRCITLTHRPIPPPAVDLQSPPSAKSAAAGAKTATAPTAAARGGGATAAGGDVTPGGAAAVAAVPVAETARSSDKERGTGAALAGSASSTTTYVPSATLLQEQKQRQQQAVTEAASPSEPSERQEHAVGHFTDAPGGEEVRQHAPSETLQSAEHMPASADAARLAAEDRSGTAAPASRKGEKGVSDKRDEDEEAEDENEKLKAATLEAMERQVELLRAEEETLRQSVLLLQEEEAQRKKMQEAETAEAFETVGGPTGADVGEPPKAATVGEGGSSNTRTTTSATERGEQQQVNGSSVVFREARGRPTAAAAPVPAAVASAATSSSPAAEGEDDASLNELARVRSGREMLQRRARRMELELRLLRRLADMQHHQQEQAFGALSRVLQAAHACRVKQQAWQQLIQSREQQQPQQHERDRTEEPRAEEHLQQHVDAERGHRLEVQSQEKRREAPGAAATTPAAAEFPETVTQLELCVEDVIRKFAEGVREVEQLMRDAKRLQMNDSDPLFYPEDHSDVEDACSLPASPLGRAEQSTAAFCGSRGAPVSASSSPPVLSSSSSVTGASYSSERFTPSPGHTALYPPHNGRRQAPGGQDSRAAGAAPAGRSCTAAGTESPDSSKSTKKATVHAGGTGC